MGTESIAWGRQRLLVLAPHADDETFGCGGLMAKVKAEGGEVYVIVASVGDLQHYGVPREGRPGEQAPIGRGGRAHRAGVAVHSGGTDGERGRAVIVGEERANGKRLRTLITGAERASELADAMACLRVDGYEVLFTDPETHLRLDAIPRRDLIARIERDARYAIDKVAPTIVILPEISYNQDHEALFKAGFTACRPHLPTSKAFVQMVLSCDAPQLGWNLHAFHPNLYVDITAHLETKLRAHACHRSQLRPAPHHASLENVERLARLRGAEVSVDAAEAYRCHRLVA
ncbi:MAG TPA: PIG-L deacetylase family protein [bacterium]|nr:PIG-L deacetylase family protein [bacterium]